MAPKARCCERTRDVFCSHRQATVSRIPLTRKTSQGWAMRKTRFGPHPIFPKLVHRLICSWHMTAGQLAVFQGAI
jgi:hypothetical protein